MKDINFIIINNDRLSFENSEVEVKQFINTRLTYFKAKTINFVDRNSLNKQIEVMSNETDYIAIVDIMNPIIDVDLITYARECLKSSKENAVKVEGAIPGTQFEYLLAPGVTSLDQVLSIFYFSQDKYNNQFNLYKYKRLKMFLVLNKLINNMPEMNIDMLINKFCERDIFERIVSFGEEIEVKAYETCPCCGSKLIPLPMNMSQAFCGYIPNSRALYHKCIKCNLVVLSPYIDYDNNYLIYDKWDKQDFVVSSNNPYNSESRRCDFETFFDKLPGKARAVDLGGGIGKYSVYLKETYPHWDIVHTDFEIKQNVELENVGIETKSLNFLKEKIGENEFDLISAWEVIEHIPYEKLDNVFENIYTALKPGGIFIFSTPNFDSPLCKMNDFYALCPPFHYLCFGESWLKNYFNEKLQWKIISSRANSDFLDDSDMWCDYAGKTAPSLQLRATANVLKILLSKMDNKKLLLDNNVGTEIIMVLQKQ